MSITIYDQVVTSFSHALRALSTLLNKAKSHAEANQYDVNVLATARLYPDMFALVRQVQLATDFAKGAAARLAGVELPKWEDSETTFEQLQARINKALAFLAALTPAQFEGAAARAIEIKTPTRTFNFTGEVFVLRWAIPNVYFHCTTVYNLLRHNGVPVGKLDFLGPV
jgi:hypothetical protein